LLPKTPKPLVLERIKSITLLASVVSSDPSLSGTSMTGIGFDLRSWTCSFSPLVSLR